MTRVRRGGREICRWCHKFPGTVHRPQATRTRFGTARGNASARAGARSRQPRRHRNRPLDRWLCVPAFRRVCPCHCAQVSKSRRTESRATSVARLSVSHPRRRAKRPRSRLCSAQRVICNAAGARGRPAVRESPPSERRVFAVSVARARRFPRRCSAARRGDPSARSRAWRPPRCRPGCRGAPHAGREETD